MSLVCSQFMAHSIRMKFLSGQRSIGQSGGAFGRVGFAGRVERFVCVFAE